MEDDRSWQTVRISAELAEALEQKIMEAPRPRPTRNDLLQAAWDALQKTDPQQRGLLTSSMRHTLSQTDELLERALSEIGGAREKLRAMRDGAINRKGTSVPVQDAGEHQQSGMDRVHIFESRHLRSGEDSKGDAAEAAHKKKRHARKTGTRGHD